ncbi:MAG TPA: PIN domain-containing protein [Pseudomonadales bacterium]|nr:PIN domain-containing protein [Pseudomonadales bacterium]
MNTHYILIDFENVQVKSLALLKGEHFHVKVFLGPKNTKLPTDLVLAMKDFGDRADYVVLEVGGNNALDFHITYYLGRLVAVDAVASYTVISKDTGFDSLVKHLQKTGVRCERAVSVETMRCFASVAPVAKAVAKLPAKPVANPGTKKKADELLAQVLANFKKRKAALPRTEKTLRSTVKTLCGVQYSEKEIEAVFTRLLKKGYVLLNDKRVSYQLPAE